MKNLLADQFPDTTSRIGDKPFRFTFSSCPTKAVSKLCSFASSNLIGRLFFLIDIGLRFSYAEIKSHGSAKGR